MTERQKLRWAAIIRGADFDTLNAIPLAGILEYAFYQTKYHDGMLKVVAALDEIRKLMKLDVIKREGEGRSVHYILV